MGKKGNARMNPGASAETNAKTAAKMNIRPIIRMVTMMAARMSHAKNAEGMSGERKNAGWIGPTKQPVSMESTGATMPVVMANTVIMAIMVIMANRVNTNITNRGSSNEKFLDNRYVAGILARHRPSERCIC